MSFNVKEALDNDGKCNLISTNIGGPFVYDARIICTDRDHDKPIVVLSKNGLAEELLYSFDFNGINNEANLNLRNVPEEIEVWIIAYRHKSNGQITLSSKMSAHDILGTEIDLKKLGHKILGTKHITINGDELMKDYKSSTTYEKEAEFDPRGLFSDG